MGVFDWLARIFVPELEDLEVQMARDVHAPLEVLRKIAESEPRLWDELLENPACPPDVTQLIHERRGGVA